MCVRDAGDAKMMPSHWSEFNISHIGGQTNVKKIFVNERARVSRGSVCVRGGGGERGVMVSQTCSPPHPPSPPEGHSCVCNMVKTMVVGGGQEIGSVRQKEERIKVFLEGMVSRVRKGNEKMSS